MTKEDIIRMAHEAGWRALPNSAFAFTSFSLERFAALVAAAEREACAKVCDEEAQRKEDEGTWLWEARRCAAAIRARGEASIRSNT